ncbi:MAG: hypothetical protein E7631_04120 [Ruminococcaceae bacterium]|nr:hypothetical protein [Oscillospiraceae bacterium]
MPKGILLCGLNGAGKSTLGHALAKAIGYTVLDAEDYYFPSQKTSRLASLEADGNGDNCPGEKIPFTDPVSKAEVQRAVLADIEKTPAFILAGVKADWDPEILSRAAVVFHILTPPDERAERIVRREVRRFGSRVLPGGDMYEGQVQFRSFAAEREESVVTDSFAGLQCPVIPLDGTHPVSDNIQKITKVLAGILAEQNA